MQIRKLNVRKDEGHELEKKMATHSSILAWRIPGMGGAWLKKKKKKKKWKQLLEQVVRLITYKKLLQMKPDWQSGASYPKI